MNRKTSSSLELLEEIFITLTRIIGGKNSIML